MLVSQLNTQVFNGSIQFDCLVVFKFSNFFTETFSWLIAKCSLKANFYCICHWAVKRRGLRTLRLPSRWQRYTPKLFTASHVPTWAIYLYSNFGENSILIPSVVRRWSQELKSFTVLNSSIISMSFKEIIYRNSKS